MSEKPIPKILSEEDVPASVGNEKRDDSLAAKKVANTFLLDLGELLLKAIIQYSGLVLVGGVFLLFYNILSKENFVNQEHINLFFDIGKTAMLLILGYMFGNRMKK